MPAAEPGPEWVLFSAGVRPRSNAAADRELVAAACSAWPKVLAHARKELLRQGIRSDETSLVTEVWESVLQSVSQTLERLKGRRGEITDLEAYLLGTFYHRFSRAVRKEQRREETISLVSSVQELEDLGATSRAERELDLEAAIHAKEIIQRMDSWSRDVWVAREYGYSWKDIGHRLGMPGHHVMLRFRRRMSILRDRLSRRR
jgi:DNA-directed RNA polymerase specialized sigma24 family protein